MASVLLAGSATWWESGVQLGSPIAIDTETERIRDALHVPVLALMTACDGKQTVLIHPADAADFALAHRRHTWLAFNLGFDFWVLEQHLAGTRGGRVVWDLADQGRFLCLRMLHRLIRLATTGEPEWEGTLADVAKEYAGFELDKSDPYRLRFGELIGLSRAEIDQHAEAQAFKEYALADVIATHAMWAPMYAHAVDLMKANGFGRNKNYTIRPDALAKWGPLSLAIQSRAAIAFERLSREPLVINQEARLKLELEHRERLAQLADDLEGMCQGLWARYKKSPCTRKLNKSTGLPKLIEASLTAKLEQVARECGKPVVMGTGKTECISVSTKAWAGHIKHDFVTKWSEYDNLRKRLSTMLIPLKASVIYAHYEPLKKTGRTSASKHARLASAPVQQVPRKQKYRDLFVADEGYVRLTIDYAYIELRTLATCCLALFGQSQMAEVIRMHTQAVRQGDHSVLDPHQWMATLSLGHSPEEFLSLPEDQQREARQRAKVANFGLSGGMGPQRLIEHAKEKEVSLSDPEARELKEKWFRAYPEMRDWLADRTDQVLADNLRVTVNKIHKKFGKDCWRVRRAIEGELDREDAQTLVDTLRNLCQNPDLLPLLSSFDFSSEQHEELSKRLLRGTSCTLTGRVRAGVGYSDGANHPFQALASDGAKEAMWRLMFAGYRVKTFIHDEILIDLPADNAERLRRRIHGIMNEVMEDVLGHDMPVESESNLGPTWKKG
jgi:hypothetical protein